MSHKRHHKRHNPEAAPPDVTATGNGNLRQEIELRAYFRYCERGCTPGGQVEDWLAAEQEVLARHQAKPAEAAH